MAETRISPSTASPGTAPACRRVLLGLAIAFLPAVTPAGVATDYLQGYARAVLDLQFPGQKIDIVGARDDGRLILSDGACGPQDLRTQVEDALGRTERFGQVEWQNAPGCAGPGAAAPLARVEPGTQQPTAAPAVPRQAQAEQTAIEALPVDELFKPLMADPRQPQFSIKYHRYNVDEDFNAASVSFGDYFGFASGLFGEYGVSQIGLQGAVFAVFNLDAPSFDLVNADYWIGIPVSVRHGPFSYLARIYHQSSHLGDEFLLGNPDIPRINLSYEDLEVLTSYEYKRWRFYGGGGVIINSEPNLDPLHAQGGVEYRQPSPFSNWQLVGAADLQASQDQDWHGNASFQIGAAYDGRANREIRFMLEHYRGFSPNGQFYNDRLRYTGLGVYFDL